ncbi:tetratricopeptide repeat protein 31 [Rhinophrynus dorsalis]
MDSDEDSYPDDYGYYNGSDEYDDDDDDDEDGSRSWGEDQILGSYYRHLPSFLMSNNLRLPAPAVITQEEADRNARELLEQEQKEKEKAEKKRSKKKRKKDRKRQKKLEEAKNETKESNAKQVLPSQQNPDVGGTCASSKPESVDLGSTSDLRESDSEDDLDLRSTFVRQAQKKMENKPKSDYKERASERSRERAYETSQAASGKPPSVCEKPVESVSVKDGATAKVPAKSRESTPEKGKVEDQYLVQQSMDLANIGNNLAKSERFMESVNYYTDAIKLNPVEYRFLGNRSYSYERSGRYQEALQDAEHALQLQPHFIKGYFRKGKALKGLKRYSEAISAFQRVLASDINHTEAAGEIEMCQLMMQSMNVSTRVRVSNNAPPPHIALGSAFSANNVLIPRSVVYKRAEGAISSNIIKIPTTTTTVPPSKSPSKLYPVWVGNVTTKITEDILRSKFEPFGPIHSMRILYSRTCAFINFSNKQSAERSFAALQGLEVEGTTFILQLRNPEHSKLPNINTVSKSLVK